MSTTGLFVRLAQTHQPDCILSLPGEAPEAAPDPEGIARALGSDAATQYASACRPVYEDLRRIIGQLAGLLILARLTTRSEVTDLPEMARCEARWNEARARLQALVAPFGLGRHKVQLESAHAFAGEVLHAFWDLRPTGNFVVHIDQMSLRIKRAYVHLQAASSTKARLDMVDFSCACCFGVRGQDTEDA